MCIMEVRPGQHSVTVAQACAHNVNTVRGDLDMFEKLLHARNDDAGIAALLRIRALLNDAYGDLLDMYGDELVSVVQSSHPHEIIGNERVHAPASDVAEINEIANAVKDRAPGFDMVGLATDIAHRAAKFETR